MPCICLLAMISFDSPSSETEGHTISLGASFSACCLADFHVRKQCAEFRAFQGPKTACLSSVIPQ